MVGLATQQILRGKLDHIKFCGCAVPTHKCCVAGSTTKNFWVVYHPNKIGLSKTSGIFFFLKKKISAFDQALSEKREYILDVGGVEDGQGYSLAQ